MKCRK